MLMVKKAMCSADVSRVAWYGCLMPLCIFRKVFLSTYPWQIRKHDSTLKLVQELDDKWNKEKATNDLLNTALDKKREVGAFNSLFTRQLHRFHKSVPPSQQHAHAAHLFRIQFRKKTRMMTVVINSSLPHRTCKVHISH